ncbi:MAG: fibronectin type III domain-containing protein [Bacteriovoracaceae bacterium]|nr:fibronectin type III domain-containing protein [Bacteriovoracaceae bacterium]
MATSCSGDHAGHAESYYAGEAHDWTQTVIKDFAGISQVDNITASTALLTWPGHDQAMIYIIYVRGGEYASWKFWEGVGNNRTAQTVQGLHPETTYSFMVKAINVYGVEDTNTKSITIQTDSAPPAPSSVSLKFPENNVSFSREPIFTVRGVSSGHTVRLFKNDPNCSPAAEVGAAVVEEAQTEVDIAVDDLGPMVGHYTFYANTTRATGYTSPCSVAFATYDAVACPDASYVPIEGNAELGTTAFCVMKTEAKNNGSDIPVSTYQGFPWVSINAHNAKAACQRIAVEGGTCDLISNPQWMTIAREIETVPANWSLEVVGEGVLSRGHTDGTPDNALEITNPTNPWDGTGDSEAVWSQKRTFTLASGEVIWDLAGNVNEWADWTTRGNTFSLGPNTCDGSWTQLWEVSCGDLQDNDYLPANPASIDPVYYNSNYHLGKFHGTTTAAREAGNGGAALRGGSWLLFSNSGPFSLLLQYSPEDVLASHGFRCTCPVRAAL